MVRRCLDTGVQGKRITVPILPVRPAPFRSDVLGSVWG